MTVSDMAAYLLLCVLFPFLMAYAAASDLLTMRISNRLTGLVFAAFVLYAVASGMTWNDLLWHLAAGGLTLVITFTFFARGWIGGGDAKLAAATALWIGLAQIAYEARFRGMTLGPRGAAPAWADLGPEGRAIWQRVADEVLAASHWRSPATEHLRTFRGLLASLAWDALRLVGLDNPSGRHGQFLLPYAGDWTYRRERREALRETVAGKAEARHGA